MFTKAGQPEARPVSRLNLWIKMLYGHLQLMIIHMVINPCLSITQTCTLNIKLINK